MRWCSHFCTVLLVFVCYTTSAQQLPPRQTTSLPVGSATIAELKGEVVLHGPQGELLSGQRGLVLSADSAIETEKGSLLLELQDGSQALVKAHSRVVLRAPDQGRGLSLELRIGKVINKITKRLGDAPSFRMGTPTAVITVRGTRFEVEVNKKLRTYVLVHEGQVEVQGLAGTGPPVVLSPGFFTQVDRDREPSQPREIGGLRERDDSGREGEGRSRSGPGSEGQRPDQGEKEKNPNRSGPDN